MDLDRGKSESKKSHPYKNVDVVLVSSSKEPDVYKIYLAYYLSCLVQNWISAIKLSVLTLG